MSKPLSIWTVYFNPTDFPGLFVVRRFELDQRTDEHYTGATLGEVRGFIPPNLYRMPRNPDDEPHIVECWL